MHPDKPQTTYQLTFGRGEHGHRLQTWATILHRTEDFEGALDAYIQHSLANSGASERDFPNGLVVYVRDTARIGHRIRRFVIRHQSRPIITIQEEA